MWRRGAGDANKEGGQDSALTVGDRTSTAIDHNYRGEEGGRRAV